MTELANSAQIDPSALFAEAVERAVSDVMCQLGSATVSARSVVAALTDWVDGVLAKGTSSRAVFVCLAKAFERRGLSLAYQTFRNYRYQTSCLVGAGVRERRAFVEGVDHAHLRMSPAAVRAERLEPVAPGVMRRAIEMVGVCGQAPARGLLETVMARLQPLRAMASSRVEAMLSAARREASVARRDGANVSKESQVVEQATEEKVLSRPEPMLVTLREPPPPGWRPPPPLKAPPKPLPPRPGAAALERVRREEKAEYQRLREIFDPRLAAQREAAKEAASKSTGVEVMDLI